METTLYHTPVLLRETLSYLLTSEDGVYVDCTLGGGGHAEGILQHVRGGRLIGFDRDPDALQACRERLRAYGDMFVSVCTPFGAIRDRLREHGLGHVHGVLLDLGVSSYQLDEPQRGFSFQEDGPLDMRMDKTSTKSAADIVNGYSENDLMSVLRNYGEERDARKIARAILARRPLQTTGELAGIVSGVVPQRTATKTLARVFQAIRIEVNAELQQLRSVLQDLPDILLPGGRVVVLTYHSLEDRIVKDFFRAQAASRDASVSRFLPERPLSPSLKILTQKPVTASEHEVATNPRARSAKLRAAERT